MFPNWLCRVIVRRLRCRRGKNLAVLVSEFLETFLEAELAPLAGLIGDLTFDVGETGQGLGVGFHGETRVVGGVCCVVGEEPSRP